MIQRFCDRCGEKMNNDEGVSSIEGYVLVKAKSGSIMNNWDCVDLCEKCKKKLYLWLMIQDSTSAINAHKYENNNNEGGDANVHDDR